MRVSRGRGKLDMGVFARAIRTKDPLFLCLVKAYATE
jgi:hypothetical protein